MCKTLLELWLLWFLYCLEATWTFPNHSNSSTEMDDWQQDTHGTCTVTHLSKLSIFISHSICQNHIHICTVYHFSKPVPTDWLSWPEYGSQGVGVIETLASLTHGYERQRMTKCILQLDYSELADIISKASTYWIHSFYNVTNENPNLRSSVKFPNRC